MFTTRKGKHRKASAESRFLAMRAQSKSDAQARMRSVNRPAPAPPPPTDSPPQQARVPRGRPRNN